MFFEALFDNCNDFQSCKSLLQKYSQTPLVNTNKKHICCLLKMLYVSFSLDEIFICDIIAVKSRNTHLDYLLQNDLIGRKEYNNEKIKLNYPLSFK